MRPVAWFAGKSTLRSGWAWGQQYLDGGAAVASATLDGAGAAVRAGDHVPRAAARHVQVLFNSIFVGVAQPSGAAPMETQP